MTDKRRRSPLWYASYRGREEIVQFLLDLGADANEQDEDGDGPLYMAVSAFREDSGSLKLVKSLISSGAELNLKNKAGETPLGMACDMERNDIAELMYQNGCD